MAVIQESKLLPKSNNPCIQNYSTVRKDRSHGQGGGLLIFIHRSITFSKRPSSPESLSDPHLEELSIKAELGNTKLIISNVYIPPASSCSNGYHSSIEHLLTRETKRKPLEMVRTFTTDLVMKAIKICRNSKAFGPDKLSIFHLKHLRPRAIEYTTALFNLSATTCRIPAIWKSSLIIPIPKPGKDTSQGTSYRPISLIYPAAKVLESLFLYHQSTNISSLLKTNIVRQKYEKPGNFMQSIFVD